MIQRIYLYISAPSTCAVMDWLKDNGYPDCDYTEIVLDMNGSYGGIVSNYIPNDLELEVLKMKVMQGKLYNGMYRIKNTNDSWVFYMPDVDKYYFMTI